MLIIKTREELKKWRVGQSALGFVPTMGALHEGHLSLIRASKQRNLPTVASVFVNPTQFNNSADLDKYPRDEEGDALKLESAGCDVLFMPQTEEIYALSEGERTRYHHDFGVLETLYEGAYRPGHFKGVGEVVHILFELVKPTHAFFGEKDYQQLLVVRKLVKMMGVSIEVIGMPTVREADGLAMSSRNLRLNTTQRDHASLIYRSLQFAKESLPSLGREKILAEIKQLFEQDEQMRLEYVDIVMSGSLEPYQALQDAHGHGVICAYAGDIRLIDNLQVS